MTTKTKVTWVALATDFYRSKTSLILRSMPDGDSIMFVWTMVLALAGELNEGGALIENGQPIPLKILANFFQKKEKILAKYFQIFTEKDMIFCENSTYYIVNWDKYQNVNSLDKIRENDKSRSKKYRDKSQNSSRDASRYHHVTNHAGVVYIPNTNNTYTDITDTEDKLDKLDKYTFVSEPESAVAPPPANVKMTPLQRYLSNLIRYRWIQPDDLRLHDYEDYLEILINSLSAREVGIRLSYFLQQTGLKLAYETSSNPPEELNAIGDRFAYFKAALSKRIKAHESPQVVRPLSPPTPVPTDEEIALVIKQQQMNIKRN